jgi:hypothetical protein
VRCSSSADSLAGESVGLGGDGEGFGGSREDSELDIGPGDGDGTSTSGGLHPLCGVGSCLPDDEDSCQSGMGGLGGGPSASDTAEAGAGAFPPDSEYPLACRVAPQAGCEGENCGVQSACALAGSNLDGEPCVASADCAAGLACVGDGLAGLCRPYCCAGSESSCDAGSYCEERSLPESPGIFVPVCVPADNCPLTDPYPCPEGQDCSCPDERACIVVRADGATACAVPGTGEAGDAECAHGYVCSPTAGCMKLCYVVAEDAQCPDGGTCQSPSEFPADLGVCVGSSTGSSAVN